MKKKKLILVLSLIFLISLFWEVSHSFLYNWNILPLENDVYYYVPKIIYSSLGDLVLISIIFFIVSLKNKRISWIDKPNKLDYLIIILSGIIVAVFVEVRADIYNKWSYNELMPILFGVGLTPLIQLAATALIALWLIRK